MPTPPALPLPPERRPTESQELAIANRLHDIVDLLQETEYLIRGRNLATDHAHALLYVLRRELGYLTRELSNVQRPATAARNWANNYIHEANFPLTAPRPIQRDDSPVDLDGEPQR